MDKPLTCQQIQQIIDEMSAAQLRDSQRHGLVHEHARQCPACRDHLAEALALADHLDQWEVPQPRRNIAASVMGRIAGQHAAQARPAPRLWNQVTFLLNVRWRMRAAAVILLLVSLAVSVSLNVRGLPGPSDRRVAGQSEPRPVTQPSASQALDGRVTTPPAVIVASQDAKQIRSLLARPELSPSALIVILGTPPGITWQPGSRPAQSTAHQDPL
jgi:hypothetical protein